MYKSMGQYYGWRPEYDMDELARVGYGTLTSWTPDETGVLKAGVGPYVLCAYAIQCEYDAGDKWLEGYE